MMGKGHPQSWPGATLLDGNRCRFVVWAPRVEMLQVHLLGLNDRTVSMTRQPRGYFTATVDDVHAGDRYMLTLNGDQDRPDPASRYQPDGVHGPSAVVDHSFAWRDSQWRGIGLSQCIFYELHIGTFTEEGTFDAVIGHLDELLDLGVSVIELMPVAQFPGSRNWGYDGASPFAVQNSYGGPDGLKRLVDACHARGLAVALDVVYNHLGPEGNYLSEFGDYFTDSYHTPWGKALSFDGPGSDEVRRYFIANALMWVDEYHIDVLRLDAVHAIYDQSAYPFLHELTDAVHRLAERRNRQVHVIAESDLNDPRLIRPSVVGGFGMDAQWNDDLHHALHALLTGERDGYYADFGSLDHLGRALRNGYVYAGDYSNHRQRHHGAPAAELPAARFVVCSQNHDQVGNRARGDRLVSIASFEQHKLAAGIILCSPYLPLLFMGEEYAERNPFVYFVSHSDVDLIEAVRAGRREEFASFAWQGAVPDPQSEQTFEQSKLDRSHRDHREGQASVRLYRDLITARREIEALAELDRNRMKVTTDERQNTLVLRRWSDRDDVALVANFGSADVTVATTLPTGCWRIVINSADERYAGPERCTSCELRAASEVKIALKGHAFILLARTHDNQE